MKNTQLMVSALLFVLLMVACAPQAIPAPQAATTPALSPAAPAPAAASAPARPAWEVEWEKTLAAAKREGVVVITTVLGPVGRTAIVEGFKKAYGIPVESVTAKGSEMAEKVLRERRAGLYNYDIYISGATTALNMLKPYGAFDSLDPALILPDVTDPELIKKLWWREKLWWIDADHTHLASALRIDFPLAINTNLVKDGEIKSMRDLLNPKWQGKLLMLDPTYGGGNLITFLSDVLGWDYVVELAKAKPIITRDERLMLEWLAHGKAAALIKPSPDNLVAFIQVGAPVKGLIPVEGTWLVGGSANLSIYNRPSYPNAAKIFINWYLSKEGQAIVAPAAGSQSARLDVPSDYLPPEQVRQPGMKYFVAEHEQLILSHPERQKRAQEILGPLMVK